MDKAKELKNYLDEVLENFDQAFAMGQLASARRNKADVEVVAEDCAQVRIGGDVFLLNRHEALDFASQLENAAQEMALMPGFVSPFEEEPTQADILAEVGEYEAKREMEV